MIENNKNKNRTKRSGTTGENSENIAPRKKHASHQSIVNKIHPVLITVLVAVLTIKR
mgnify:CR=1 FL=1